MTGIAVDVASTEMYKEGSSLWEHSTEKEARR